MSADWPKVRLTEIYDIRSGLSKPAAAFGSGFPFLSFKEVFNNFFLPDNLTQLVQSTENERTQGDIRRGDVFLTRTSETLDELGMSSIALKDYPNATFNGFTKRLRPRTNNQHHVYPEYIGYYLRSQSFRGGMLALSSMSTRASLNNEMIGRLEVVLPPIDIQKIIASALKCLDDKIALNRRINQTLEAMAQAIFKSWFVDFDPVKAKITAIEQGQDPLRAAMRAISGKTDAELDQMPREHHDQLAATAALFPDAMEESELGEIPKGWRREAIGCYFDLTMGQSPPGNTYNETGEGMPFYQGRTDFGVRFPTERVYCTAPTRLAKKGDVLVSVRAPVGDINVAVSDCAIGRGVAAVRYEHPSFALYVLRHQEPAFKRFESDGTVFGSINKKQFESLPFVMAPDELVRRFQSLVGPLDEKIESNEWKMRNIAILRDTLLPKLLSGELRVPDIEHIAEEV